MSNDSNPLAAKAKRYAKVSTNMAGLATRLAGEKFLGLKIDRADHAKQLREALGGLKGPLMKVAQLLSTIPDALPPEYVQELAQLQADAPAMGWLFVKRRLGFELGADWRSKFVDFSPEAVSAASLGQVHQASLADGSKVAVKLQYPDMQAVVDADLRQLKLIFTLFEAYDKAVSTGDIHQEISERLREELDYRREARHMQLYQYMLRDEKNVRVPSYFPELSTDRLLTMSWLEGDKLANHLDGSQEARNQLALNMFRAWYVPFYYYGVIHGDPHMGNYTVRPDGGINLLDFGCVRIFRPDFVGAVIDLYRALDSQDMELAASAYKVWGFDNISKELLEVLNIWASFIYGPLLEDKVRPIGIRTGNGIYGREVAEKVHQELRRVGGVKIPREFVFMDRAALGLGSVFIHLNAAHNWRQLFQELIADFNLPALAKRQQLALKKFNLSDA